MEYANPRDALLQQREILWVKMQLLAALQCLQPWWKWQRFPCWASKESKGSKHPAHVIFYSCPGVNWSHCWKLENGSELSPEMLPHTALHILNSTVRVQKSRSGFRHWAWSTMRHWHKIRNNPLFRSICNVGSSVHLSQCYSILIPCSDISQRQHVHSRNVPTVKQWLPKVDMTFLWNVIWLGLLLLSGHQVSVHTWLQYVLPHEATKLFMTCTAKMLTQHISDKVLSCASAPLQHEMQTVVVITEGNWSINAYVLDPSQGDTCTTLYIQSYKVYGRYKVWLI